MDSHQAGRSKYGPTNPRARGAAIRAPYTPEPGTSPVLSGVVGDNRELIAEARRLWIGADDNVADVTWGRGAFWPKGASSSDQPQFRYDLRTQPESVDCRDLPHGENSLDVIVFDPPYRPSHGGDQDEYYTHYGLATSGLDSMDDVLNLYRDGIAEAFRVLRPRGRILVKCQDMSYSGRLHLVHLDVIRHMERAGFHFADMFVLVNKNRRHGARRSFESGDEALETAPIQERARRSHSYLLVGSKPSAGSKTVDP